MSISTYFRLKIHQNGHEILRVKYLCMMQLSIRVENWQAQLVLAKKDMELKLLGMKGNNYD
jgi:hypothetical protein